MGLAKTGSNTLTINVIPTYTGDTLVSGGTLLVDNDPNAGSGTGPGIVTVRPGSTLQIGNNDANGSIAGNIVNNGTMIFSHNTPFAFANNVTSTVNGASIQFIGTNSTTLTGSLASANTTDGAIIIAPNAPDATTVFLNGGTLSTPGGVSVGSVGSGVLVINNGFISQTANGSGLRVGGNSNTQGSNAGGTGTVYLAGGGIALAGDVNIGWGGTGGGGVGTFYQTGGTMTLAAGRTFYVGLGGGGTGTYNLLGGSVTNLGATNLGVGGAGSGTAHLQHQRRAISRRSV